MYTPKRAPQSKEPYYTYICIYHIYIYTPKSTVYTLKRALRLPLSCSNVWGATCDQFQQEFWSKEPYIHPKEPYIHLKEPYIYPKEPYIHSPKSIPLYTAGARVSRAIYIPQRAIYTPKRATYTPKRSLYGLPYIKQVLMSKEPYIHPKEPYTGSPIYTNYCHLAKHAREQRYWMQMSHATHTHIQLVVSRMYWMSHATHTHIQWFVSHMYWMSHVTLLLYESCHK